MSLDSEIVYILGNKNDLEQKRQVSFEEGKKVDVI